MVRETVVTRLLVCLIQALTFLFFLFTFQLPLSLLRAAQDRPMLVELKNGDTYNGHLVNCDTWMNINLRDVICTSRVSQLPYSALFGCLVVFGIAGLLRALAV